MLSSVFKQISWNLITGWISVLIRCGIALVMVPFLLTHLGREGYGLIGLLGTILGFSQVADLGLRQALGRELTEQVARRDDQTFNELATSALALYLVIASVLALAGWMMAPWLVGVFKVSETFQSEAIWMIRIYGAGSVLLAFIIPVFSAGLASHHRFDMVNSTQIAAGIISSLLLFLVLPIAGNALFGWVGIMLISQVATLVLMVVFFCKYCEGKQVHPRFLSPSRLRPLFHLGGYMYVLQMTRALAEKSDPLVISYFFGPAGVALYQPGGRLSQMIRPMVTMLSDQLLPLSTQSHIQSDQGRQKRILYDGTRFILLLGALFTAGLVVFAEPFCRLWLESTLGPDYRIAAVIMMSWAVVDFTTYVSGTSWSIMLGKGVKTLRPATIIRAITSILNIALSIWLVGYTRLGIPGVLVATIATEIVMRPVFIRIVAGFCKISTREYFMNAHARGLLVSALLPPLMILIRWVIPLDNYLQLVCGAALGGVCWLGLCWSVGLKLSERVRITGAVKQKLSGIRSKGCM
jgi:O-antigen/teichoic acid export membrane protein